MPSNPPRSGFLTLPLARGATHIAFALAFALGALGCQEDKPRIGGLCDDATPCPAGQICLDGLCGVACATQADCPAGLLCQDEICTPPCERASDCPQPPVPNRVCAEAVCRVVDPPGLLEVTAAESVPEGENVVLSAADSLFVLPERTTLEWEFLASLPKGPTVELLPANGPSPLGKADAITSDAVRFTAPSVVEDTELRFRVVARDDAGHSTTREFSVMVLNTINEPPEIVLEQTSVEAEGGALVELSAVNTRDPNPGDSLTFSWSYAGYSGALELVDAADPVAGEPPLSRMQFLAPMVTQDTILLFTLTVSDGEDAVTASVEVLVFGAAQECDPGDDAACDDGNPCTDSACVGGACVHDLLEGTPCDDGDACTLDDTCQAGACQPGAPAICDDGDPCTGDACDAQAGCQFDPIAGPCDDGDACTVDDTCQGGACVGAPLFDCDDGNPCTDDTCDPEEGCAFLPVSGPCDDGNPCTTLGACEAGQCVGGAPVLCDDGNPCTVGACEGAQGCVFTPVSGACDDGDVCTLTDTCQGGVCVGTGALACDDGNPCTSNGCDPAEGCTFSPTSGPCDDGNACTADDTCQAGSCQAGPPLVCDDANECTNDSCSPANGCVHTPSSPKPCSDGDACTTSDTCQGGVCVGGPPPACVDGNPCTEDNCDPASGCVFTPLTGPSCDDGEFCTIEDACAAGVCQGGAPNPECQCEEDEDCAAFDDSNPCTGTLQCASFQCQTVPGSPIQCSSASNTPCQMNVCSAAAGGCQMVNVNPGGACDDGNACTTGDQCQAGQCVGTGGVSCDDDNPCTGDACLPSTGCTHTPIPGTPCDDGNACTTSDVCVGSQCQGTAVSCDDGNPCTADSCQAASGCVYTPTSGSCDDGNACTQGTQCSAGACGGGSPVNCSDGNPCTVASCNASTGCAQTPLSSTPCDDGNACTGPDTCNSGVCGGPSIACNDGNPCTADSCDPAIGCVFTPTSGPCSDGNVCTIDDLCQAGECVGGAPLPCDDGNVCTSNGCNPASGCTSTPASGACEDGNLCTDGDTCQGGTCVSGPPLSCSDGNPCTFNGCNPATGCTAVNVLGACSDGDACTVDDFCQGGNCQPGAPLVCNDGNACTAGACDPGEGCVFTPVSGPCDDGDPCTTDETCQGGECVPGAFCECETDEDCVDDGNLCNGTPVCDPETLSCVIDPSTIITCPTAEAGACTAPTCVPSSGACVPTPLASGTPCSDNNACTASDQCNGQGACVGTSIECDDGNDCTLNQCDPSQGCTFPPASGACDDGDACTTNDFCQSGQCQGGPPPSCADGNPCTANPCQPAIGCTTVNITGACSDGNACTSGDTCQGGQCVSGPPTTCADGNPCTSDACDPASGCVFTPLVGADCSDGNACTVGDSCGSSGQCVSGPPAVCNDGNPCTNDGCSPSIGCTHTPNNQPCDDGNLCTQSGQCQNGQCQSGPPVSCDDGNPCTNDSCSPSTGCQHSFNALPCDNGDPCTTGDFCSQGQCQSGQSVCACASDGDCPDDGNACTGTLFCDLDSFPFACKTVPGSVVQCPAPADSCVQASCNPQSGQCESTPVPNGTPCDDGNACSLGERCQGGECSIGPPAGCITSTGPGCFGCACEACVCAADPFCCDNSWDNLCVNRCAGECGQACDVDPYVPAPDPGCAAGQGATCPGCPCELCVCENDPFCCDTQWDDICAGGCADCGSDCEAFQPGCVAKTTPGCGGCDCASCVCEIEPSCCEVAWGPACVNLCGQCSEGLACSTAPVSNKPGCAVLPDATCGGCACESCVCEADPFCCQSQWDNLCVQRCEGQCGQDCTNDSTLFCDDGNPCTLDTCLPSEGCVHLPLPDGAYCDDGDPCTASGVCQGGQCSGQGGGVNFCDDGNPCTTDLCFGGKCSYEFNTLPCDDGNPCTTQGTCTNGQCVGSGTVGCDDGDPCTVGSCSPTGGCSFSPAPMGTPCANSQRICGFGGQCKNWTVNAWPAPQLPPEHPARLFGVHEVKGQLFAVGGGGQSFGGPETMGFIYAVAPGTSPSLAHLRPQQLNAIFGPVAVGTAGAVSWIPAGQWTQHLAAEKFFQGFPNFHSVWAGEVGLMGSGNLGVLIGADGFQVEQASLSLRQCTFTPDGSASCTAGFNGGPLARVRGVTAMSQLTGFTAPIYSITQPFALAQLNQSQPTHIFRPTDGMSGWSNNPPLGCNPGQASAPCRDGGLWTDLTGDAQVGMWATASAGRLLAFGGQSWQAIDPRPGVGLDLPVELINLRGVVFKGSDVFIAAEIPGCGTGKCALDPNFEAHVLLHFNQDTGNWFPMRVLGAYECPFGNPKECGSFFSAVAVEDIWWSTENHLAVVGSRLQNTPQGLAWRLLNYAISLD